MAENIEVLKINGYDFTPLLAEKGVVYKKNDVDSSDAGELASGKFRRDRVIIRPTLAVKLNNAKIFIDDDMIFNIMEALEPQMFSVKYFDPRLGQLTTRRFYTNDVEVTLWKIESGKRRWILSDFTLVAEGVPGDGKAKL